MTTHAQRWSMRAVATCTSTSVYISGLVQISVQPRLINVKSFDDSFCEESTTKNLTTVISNGHRVYRPRGSADSKDNEMVC